MTATKTTSRTKERAADKGKGKAKGKGGKSLADRVKALLVRAKTTGRAHLEECRKIGEETSQCQEEYTATHETWTAYLDRMAKAAKTPGAARTLQRNQRIARGWADVGKDTHTVDQALKDIREAEQKRGEARKSPATGKNTTATTATAATPEATAAQKAEAAEIGSRLAQKIADKGDDQAPEVDDQDDGVEAFPEADDQDEADLMATLTAPVVSTPAPVASAPARPERPRPPRLRLTEIEFAAVEVGADDVDTDKVAAIIRRLVERGLILADVEEGPNTPARAPQADQSAAVPVPAV